MHVQSTSITEVMKVIPDVLGDERGFFMETWQRRRFAEAGIDHDFVQDNHSRSVQGTLRGLHYQLEVPQGKLVRVTLGEVFDVAVDLRQSSPTFGQWVGEYLSAGNKRMLWIPPGFAHGFYVTSDVAELQYKCTDYYAPADERCIRWDDATIAVDWPMEPGVAPILSERDQGAPALRDAEVFA